MRLRDNIKLPVDSFATRRADSLFGDSYVEIIPGAGDVGAGNVRLLASGEPIAHVEEGASTDRSLRTMERTIPQIERALDIVHEAVGDSREWVLGSMNSNLVGAGDWLKEGHIEGPLSTAHGGFERLYEISEAAAKVGDTDVDGTLARWNAQISATRQSMADAKRAMAAGMQDTRVGIEKIDDSVSQYTEVLAQIDRGEGDTWRGRLGRLVNDPEVADSIEEGVDSVREGVSGYGRFKSWLGARVELGAVSREFRFYATAEIRARTDKFYLVEFEKSALGGVPEDSISDAPNADGWTRRQTIRDRLRFTAQFGKQFGPLQVRGGVKDSTFGIGTDVLLARGRLKFSADLFGSFFRTPRLKVAAALAVFRSIYVIAGVDDVLNPSGELNIRSGNTPVPIYFNEVHFGRDYFVGAALHFDDADLATLLRVYGAVLVGLL
jgi:phospholipid/cholesterol/gamma-HCH transport system substrate-binding protein